MITPTAGTPRSGHTGSSQYAPVISDMESDESLGVHRIPLGPSGEAMIRDRINQVGARSADPPKLNYGQLQSYFEVAIRK